MTCALSSPVGVLPAQRGPLDDVAYVTFGRRDGLPDAPALSLRLSRDGQLLLATGQGARRFDGLRWLPLEPRPEAAPAQVREVFDRANGDRVFVQSFGVLVQRASHAVTAIALPDGTGPIYSGALIANGRGSDEVYLSGEGGLFRVHDGAIERVAIPEGLGVRDVMVAAGREPDELWVSVRAGGVARRLRGEWTVWGANDGLGSLEIEQLVLPSASDSLTALVATQRGAFALNRGRWVPIGPRMNISRVLRFTTAQRHETWLGGFGGEIYRTRDDVEWQRIDLTMRTRGARVQILTAIDHGLGHPTVYAGFRSGAVIRFRIGVAGRLELPADLSGRPVLSLSALSRGVQWAWIPSIGALRLPDLHRVRATPQQMGAGEGRAKLVSYDVGGTDALFLLVESRVYQMVGDAFVLRYDAGAANTVQSLVRAYGPTGRPALVAVSLNGAAYSENNGPFRSWPKFPTATRTLLVDSTTSPASLISVRLDRSLRRFTAAGWDTIPGGPYPLGAGIVDARLMQYPGGTSVLLVASTDGVAMLRLAPGVAQWETPRDFNEAVLRRNEVTSLEAISNRRTAIGTSFGLVVLVADSLTPGRIRAARSFTDADGLPHVFVNAIGSQDSAGRLWVGTTQGVGYLNTTEVDKPRAPMRITSIDLRDGRGEAIAEFGRVPEEDGRIDAEVTVSGFHREDETTYRFELDGKPLHPSAWVDRPSISLIGVAAGTHVLRVRVRDFEGDEAASVERQFTVQRAWWRSALVIPIAALLAIGATLGFMRARTKSARRQAEEAEANERRIAVSESRFRRLFEDGSDPQLLVLDGAIWQLNAAACTLLDPQQCDLRGRRVDEVIAGLSALTDSDATNASGRWELEATAPGDVRIPVDVRRTRIPLEGAVLDHLELTDLRPRNQLERERRELEEQLREAQRLESVGTLAGGVAHDFNNLLTIIHTNAELAFADVTPGSEPADALQQLLLASGRAREVVRQILTFSRRARTHRTAVSLDALMAETQSLLRSMIPSTIRVHVLNTATDAVVDGDATQLQQLLLNLCSNAEYAMRGTGGGTLVIAVSWKASPSVSGNTVCLRVSDTGAGISPDVRARMFEPFFTTKPVGEGTGLGLSVLHGIVGAHGGTIAVESEVNRGTTIEVTLPARRVVTVPAEPISPAVPGVPAVGRRVLLVDDEPAVLTVVQRLLTRHGYRVETAADGAEALACLRADRALDLVITDQTMPMMTGVELITAMRRSGMTIPVILTSGFGAAVDQAGIEGLSAVWRMDKPFVAAEFLQLVSQVVASAPAP